MWVAPMIFPAIGDLPLVAIDTETDDKGLQAKMGSGWFNKNGEVLGISVAFYYNGEIQKAYYPIGHASGNLPKETVVRWLKKELAKPNTKVFHNAVYDIGWLGTEGIEVKGTVYDTGYAAALLDENRFSYRLDDLAKEELGIGKDYTRLEEYVKDHGKELDIRTVKQLMSRLKDLPASLVGEYAEQDAEITLRLWAEKYEKDLHQFNLFSLYQLECRGIPLLIAMRKQGVPIDIPRIKELIVEFKGMEEKLKKELDEMAGEEFPLTRTKKHTEIIVKVVGEENFKKSEAGNYLTGKKHTNGLDHPFIKKLNELNSVTKLRKEFLENFLKFEVNGRLHPEFHPLKSSDMEGGKLISTTTGRFSSSSPNLTNIPADGELGHKIRSCFIPEPGCEWLCVDYSQQEYRWAAHYAIKAKCRGYKTVLQMYKDNPNLDFHNMGSMLLFGNTDKHNRKKVKTTGFGILYGSGTTALAQSLNMTRQEAEKFLSAYHEKVPFVKDIADKARLHATYKGTIRTVLGRIRRYDFWEVKGDYKHQYGVVKGEANARLKQNTPGSPWYGQVIQRCKTYTAINSACQGSSADQTKLAVITLFEKYGLVPYTIVHDEINLAVPKGDTKIEQIVVDTMENVLHLEVPVRAEGKVAENWSEAKG